MGSKIWNTCAEKDLFLTILSMKDIGVISRAEWVTIGRHMQILGHNFSNEGCRQHFQGLRRSRRLIRPFADNATTPEGGSGSSADAAENANQGTTPTAHPPFEPVRRRRKKSSAAAKAGVGGEGEGEAKGEGSGVIEKAYAATSAGTNNDPDGAGATTSFATMATSDGRTDMPIGASGHADTSVDTGNAEAIDAGHQAKTDFEQPPTHRDTTVAASSNGLNSVPPQTHPHSPQGASDSYAPIAAADSGPTAIAAAPAADPLADLASTSLQDNRQQQQHHASQDVVMENSNEGDETKNDDTDGPQLKRRKLDPTSNLRDQAALTASTAHDRAPS
ncbi:hypothetical protein SEPCBS57363_002627 [Sporothrix epigloea]|uniref:Myb-like domain-containing protein n=1 Tax=Sporothrix epigloea TaxID=1892477 RepID=A0ABP0DKG0_9PEZI